MRFSRQPLLKIAVSLLGLAWGLGSASAQSTWNLNANGDWATATNWSPSTVPNSSGATAILGSVITAPTTLWIGGNTTVGTLSFSSSANYTVASSGSIYFLFQTSLPLGTVALDNSGSGSPNLTPSIYLNSPLVVTQAGTGILTITGNIQASSGSITKYGSGTLLLAGDNAYAGGTFIDQGTIAVAAETALGNGTNITINGGTLQINGNITTLGANIYSTNQPATRYYTIGSGGANFNIQSNYTLTFQNNPAGGTGGGSVLIGSGTLTNTGTGTLVLGGGSTGSFAGSIEIDNGKVQIAAETNLGATAGSLTLNGGTLESTSSYTSSSKVYTVGTNGGTLQIDTGATVTFGSTSNLTGTGNLTESGGGTLILSGNNTGYTGTNIITGTVQISAENNLGTTSDSLIISNGGTLVVAGTFTDNAKKVMYIGSGGGTIDVLAGNTNTLGSTGQISGSNVFTVTGGGQLAISGNNNATWGGTTIVSNGTLAFNGAGTATALTNVTVTARGTLLIDNSTTANSTRLSTTAGVTLNGGAIVFNGDATTAVSQQVGALTLAGGDSTIYVNSRATTVNTALNFSSLVDSSPFSTISFENTNIGNLGNGTPNPTIGFTNAPTTTNGIIAGWATARATNGGQLVFATMNGGSVSTLSTYSTGTNTGWNANANVQLTNNQTLAAGNSVYTLTMTNGRQLNLGTHTLTNTSGGLIAQTGDTAISNGVMTAGASGVGGTLYVHVDTGGFLTNYSVLTNNGTGVVNLVKANGGTLLLGGANAYTGATYVNGGTLELISANAVPTGSDMTVATGATFNLNGFNQTLGSLAGAGTVTNSSGTLTVGGDNASTTFSGSINGNGALTKAGSGTMILSGSNSFGGNLTISGGTLSVSQDANLGATTNLTVLSGGTLGVTESFTANSNRVLDVASAGGYINVSANQTLTFTTSNAWTGTGNLTNSGAGTVVFAGSSNFTGNLAINGGGTVEVQGSSNVVFNTLNSNFISHLTGTSGTLMYYVTGDNYTYTVTNSPAAGSPVLIGFNASASSTNANYTFGSASPANSLSNWGGMVIHGGTVSMAGNETLVGNGVAPTTLEIDGGTLILAGGNPSGGKVLTISGNAYLNGGEIEGGPGGGSQGTIVTSGSIYSDGTVLVNTPNITMTPANGVTNVVAGTTPLEGISTFTVGTGASNGTVQLNQRITVSTGIQINSGTLLLGASYVINDSAPVTMLNNTTLATGGYQQTLGALTLGTGVTSATATLSLGYGTNSYLAFANSASQTWNGTLVISNYYNSWDQVYFGTSSNGLTASQLASIEWINPYGNGVNFTGAIIEGNGLIQPVQPVPEAKTVAALFLLSAFALWHERKRLAALLAGPGWTAKPALARVRGYLLRH